MSALPNPVGLLWSLGVGGVNEGREAGWGGSEREGGGGITCSCLQWLRPTVLHSSTWYSRINSLPSLAFTSGRARQCPPLFYRHILWSQHPHQPHTPSHVSVMFQSCTFGLQRLAWALAQLGLSSGSTDHRYFLQRKKIVSEAAHIYFSVLYSS